MVLFGIACSAAASLIALRLLRRAPWPLRLLGEAALLKCTFSARALGAHAAAVQRALEHGDITQAREAVQQLVSRDTSELDAAHVASAAIESVAESTLDSIVGPLFWYGLFGVPGAAAYRFVNTADAMVGYRGRYEYFGKPAARLDDALNWLPARLSTALLAAAATLTGGDTRGAWATALDQHARTASPNAGWPMAAAAGALGVWLEKPDHYRLGRSREPAASDISRAVRLMSAAAVLSVGLALLVPRRG
jgi:adenosylcobinamide-phosphate synthase